MFLKPPGEYFGDPSFDLADHGPVPKLIKAETRTQVD
jgi:hypothetical protein